MATIRFCVTFASCYISPSFLTPGHLKIDSSLLGEAPLKSHYKSTWFNIFTYRRHHFLSRQFAQCFPQICIQFHSCLSGHVIPLTERLPLYNYSFPLHFLYFLLLFLPHTYQPTNIFLTLRCWRYIQS